MNMNLEQENKGLFVRSNTVNGHDKTTTKSINAEYDSVDITNFHITIVSAIGKGTNDESNNTAIMVDEKLRNAIDGLQMVSEGELQQPPHTIMCRKNLPHDDNDEVDVEKAALMETVLSGGMQSVIGRMNRKAMKLLPAQLANNRDTSPSPLPKLKSKGDISINQSTSKHVIKTISNTADGIHLKEEKINFFGIPVTTNHKKRTQVKPFNFQIRKKENQQLLKTCTTSTVFCKSAISSNNVNTKKQNGSKPSKNNTQIDRPNKISSNTIVPEKMKQTINEVSPSRLEDELRENITLRKSKPEVLKSIRKMNKENDVPNKIMVGSQERKSEYTVVDPKPHADQRHQFRLKMKKRELEIEEMRAHVEQKRREKEEFRAMASRKGSGTETPNSCQHSRFQGPLNTSNFPI